MRVTEEHLNELRAVLQFDLEETREAYRRGDFPRADAVKDLDKRYRWDLYWHTVSQGIALPDSTCGYNDSHIDTALRSIVAPLVAP